MASAIAMRGLISRFLCLIAAIALMDGHIVALQSYAWVTMLHDRIPEQGVSEAIATTFNGEHPCEHCLAAQNLRAVESQQEPEQDSNPQLNLSGLKLVGLTHKKISPPAAPRAVLLHHQRHITLCADDPATSVPTPPPRLG